MSQDQQSGSDLDELLAMSRSADTGNRVDAVQALGRRIDQPDAFHRLTEMLRDQNVTVMVDAAEMLARRGGNGGVRAVIEELGRTADDPDADYIMYKLEELEALGEVPILRIARALVASEESPDFRAGLIDVENYMGHHNPK